MYFLASGILALWKFASGILFLFFLNDNIFLLLIYTTNTGNNTGNTKVRRYKTNNVLAPAMAFTGRSGLPHLYKNALSDEEKYLPFCLYRISDANILVENIVHILSINSF